MQKKIVDMAYDSVCERIEETNTQTKVARKAEKQLDKALQRKLDSLQGTPLHSELEECLRAEANML